MTKRLLTLAIAGMMSAASLCAQDTPVLKWAALQDGCLAEISHDVTGSANGNVYFLNDFFTKADPVEEQTTDYVYLDLANKSKTIEATLKGGSGLNENGGTPNMALLKTDANGHLLWQIHTNQGDFAQGGAVAPTSDDGVVVVLKARNNFNRDFNVLANFIDQDGVETQVTWENKTNETIYQPVVVKVSKDGKIEWAKHFEVACPLLSNEKHAADAFNIGGAATDENDNFYISGSFRTSINFGEKANFTQARNVPADWNGSIQGTSPQDMFVVKLDKNGNALWGTKIEGEAIVNENATNIVYSPAGKLIISGYMTGNNTTAVKIGESSFVPNDVKSLFVASINPENGQFVNGQIICGLENGTEKRPEIKPMGMSISGNNLYLSGSFKGDMKSGDNVLVSNASGKFHAYALKANAATGEIVASVHVDDPNNAKEILEIEDIYETEKGIVATGYGLFSNSYIYTFDKDLTAGSMKAYTAKESKMGSSSCSALVGNILVNAMRGKDKVTFPEQDWTLTLKASKSQKFGCVFTGHEVSLLSGVEENTAENNDFKVIGGFDGITVVAAEACEVRIYNMLGSLVNALDVNEGTTSVSLEKGIYIVNGIKTIVR